MVVETIAVKYSWKISLELLRVAAIKIMATQISKIVKNIEAYFITIIISYLANIFQK